VAAPGVPTRPRRVIPGAAPSIRAAALRHRAARRLRGRTAAATASAAAISRPRSPAPAGRGA